jgi:hypothetical protein
LAGTLLTIGATTLVPAAYAGDDGDANKNKAEYGSAAAIVDCDDNDVDNSEFDCFGIAVNDIDADLGGIGGVIRGLPLAEYAYFPDYLQILFSSHLFFVNMHSVPSH